MSPRSPTDPTIISECFKLKDDVNDQGKLSVTKHNLSYSFFNLEEYSYTDRIQLAKCALYGDIKIRINNEIKFTTEKSYDISKLIGENSQSIYPLAVINRNDDDAFTQYINNLSTEDKDKLTKVINHENIHIYYNNCKSVDAKYNNIDVNAILEILQKIFNNLDALTDYRINLENLQTSVSANDLKASVNKAESVANNLVKENSKALIRGLELLFKSCIYNDDFSKLKNGNSFIRDAFGKKHVDDVKQLNTILQN